LSPVPILNTRRIICVLLFVFPISGFGQGSFTSFNLKDCLRYGLQHSSLLKKDSLEKEVARQETSISRSGYLPQIGAAVGYRQYFNLPTYLFPAEEGSVFVPGNNGNPVPVGIGGNATLDVFLEVEQKVFAHEWSYSKDYMALTEELLELKKLTTETAVLSQIAYTFYEVLSLSASNQVIDFNLSRIEKLEDIVQDQVTESLVTPTALGKLRLEKTEIDIRKEQLQYGIAAKKKLLKFLMGMPFEEELFLSSVASSQTIIKDSLNQNQTPYLNLLEKQLEQQSFSTKTIQSEYFPSAKLEGNFGYQYLNDEFSPFAGSSWFPLNYIGLTVDIPIFYGNQKNHKLQQSQSQSMIATLDVQQKKLEHQIKWESAWEDYLIKQKFVRLNKQKRDYQNNVVKEKNLLYIEELIDLRELLEFQTEQRKAEQNYIESLYNLKTSEIKLLELSGDIKNLIEE
jgi:outer membrane protein TolC